MSISPINNYAALSQAYWFDKYGFSARQNSNLPPVEPIAAIGRAINDIDDINYEKVAEFERKVFAGDKKNIETKADKSDIKNDKVNKEIAFDEDKKVNGDSLSDEEKAVVEKLKVIDTKVRLHEQAHLSVAGDLATSGASYTYQQGPDGKQYAVGGEVNIDTSSEDTPEKTIDKMQRVIAAAMAPAEPSGQDYSVAAAARQNIVEMKSQIMQRDNAEASEAKSTNKNDNSNKINNSEKPGRNSINQEFTSQNNINTKLESYRKTFTDKGIYANFVA